MPPKVKHIDPGVTQGIGRQSDCCQNVFDTFSDMPDGGKLLNGHVMCIFIILRQLFKHC